MSLQVISRSARSPKASTEATPDYEFIAAGREQNRNQACSGGSSSTSVSPDLVVHVPLFSHYGDKSIMIPSLLCIPTTLMLALTSSELQLRYDLEQFVGLFELEKVYDPKYPDNLTKLVGKARFVETRMVTGGKYVAYYIRIFGEKRGRSLVFFVLLLFFFGYRVIVCFVFLQIL